MNLSRYLFDRVRDAGADVFFGIPGDFALPLFHSLEDAGHEVRTVVHEPAAGYAADAYARLRGFGAVVVTYGAGALNLVNAIAQAYAERSPVLVISGAPETYVRSGDLMVHHRVKTFESQLRVFDEVCVATAVLDDPSRASSEIERVLAAMKTNKRPGYIEVPRDLTNAEIEVVPPKSEAPAQLEAGLLEEALADVRDRLDRAERPVVYAGLEIERFGHRGALLELVEALGVPCATSMAGKAVFPETHPQFVGTYMGAVGPESARAAVEEADLVLALGTLATDVNLGLYTATLDRTRIVHATEDRLRVSHHVYRGVRTGDVIRGIATETRRWSMPSRLQYATGEFSSVGPITVPGIVGLVNRFVTRRSATVC